MLELFLIFWPRVFFHKNTPQTPAISCTSTNRPHMVGLIGESGAVQLVECTGRFRAIADGSLLSIVPIDEIAWRLVSTGEDADE